MQPVNITQTHRHTPAFHGSFETIQAYPTIHKNSYRDQKRYCNETSAEWHPIPSPSLALSIFVASGCGYNLL